MIIYIKLQTIDMTAFDAIVDNAVISMDPTILKNIAVEKN
jgi:hypothetical protein